MRNSLIIILLLLFPGFRILASDSIVSIDKNIGLTKLTTNIYLLKSSFACNGELDCNHLLILDPDQMVLINTPSKDSLTAVMLGCVEKKFKRKVTKVIVSHFHNDSSAGLPETKRRGIISYGLDLTRNLLKSENKNLDVVFTDSLTIQLQKIKLHLFYFGAGHSIDNIVTWIPDGKILFGGCMIKSLDTENIGNIRDADLKAWPVTVQKIKVRFKDVKLVIPGHLGIGDSSLFDHTLKIIKTNKL